MWENGDNFDEVIDFMVEQRTTVGEYLKTFSPRLKHNLSFLEKFSKLVLGPIDISSLPPLMYVADLIDFYRRALQTKFLSFLYACVKP